MSTKSAPDGAKPDPFWEQQDQMFKRVQEIGRSNVNAFGEAFSPAVKLPCEDMSTYKLEDCKTCRERGKCDETTPVEKEKNTESESELDLLQ
jgi:hypothetical protein